MKKKKNSKLKAKKAKPDNKLSKVESTPEDSSDEDSSSQDNEKQGNDKLTVSNDSSDIEENSKNST